MNYKATIKTMAVFPVFWRPFPHYIKKEDAGDILKCKKLTFISVLAALALIVGVMQLTVYPRLNNLYVELNFQKPLAAMMAPYFSLAAVLASAAFASYVYFSGSMDKVFHERLKQYKGGEMIKSKDLIGKMNEDKLLFVLIAVVMGFLITSIILPVYDVTSSIQ
ncbi:hypothetical protein L6258_00945 [Candidatus Parcubacteria bacterium]|nr:hypothetical protein [Candidatus Parcubacteria bacterium]